MIGLLATTTLFLLPQGAPAGAASRPGSAPQLDERGWPVVAPGALSVPGKEPAAAGRQPAEVEGSGEGGRTLALESPLRDVFATVAEPASFRALGGVVVWWRVHLFGSQGETAGMLEITQEADLRAPDRDRLQYPDERTYGRYGATLAVRRHGMPWPSLEDEARQELELFSVLLRMPWEFADPQRYAVLPAQSVRRDGEELVRVPIVRTRAAAGGGTEIGPGIEPQPADRYELWCEPGSMLPRELVYRRADAGVTRRMLLEDWRQTGGVRLPWRRVLVDAEGRRTTVLQILRLEVGRELGERELLRR